MDGSFNVRFLLDGSFIVRFPLNDRAVFCLPQLCFWLSECDVLHSKRQSGAPNVTSYNLAPMMPAPNDTFRADRRTYCDVSAESAYLTLVVCRRVEGTVPRRPDGLHWHRVSHSVRDRAVVQAQRSEPIRLGANVKYALSFCRQDWRTYCDVSRRCRCDIGARNLTPYTGRLTHPDPLDSS